jgi:hypothetical protein
MVAMFSASRARADVSPQIAVDDVRSQSKQGAHDVQPETGLGSFTFFAAPAEKPVNHEQNKTLSMSPIKLGTLLQVATLKPHQLEGSCSEPLSLAEALNYALDRSSPLLKASH